MIVIAIRGAPVIKGRGLVLEVEGEAEVGDDIVIHAVVTGVERTSIDPTKLGLVLRIVDARGRRLGEQLV